MPEPNGFSLQRAAVEKFHDTGRMGRGCLCRIDHVILALFFSSGSQRRWRAMMSIRPRPPGKLGKIKSAPWPAFPTGPERLVPYPGKGNAPERPNVRQSRQAQP